MKLRLQTTEKYETEDLINFEKRRQKICGVTHMSYAA